MNLKEEDYKRLLSIPYKTISETDQFCLNVIQIIHENLIQNPKLCKMLLRHISDEEMRKIVVECLKHYYESNKLRESILLFMVAPEEAETRRAIFHNIESILFEPETPHAEKLAVLLSYLRKLALCSAPNKIALLLHEKTAKTILESFTAPQKAELYSYFVHINMKFFDMGLFETLKLSLLRGSNMDKLIAKTGVINPKWHHTNDIHFSDEHKEKMVNFFTFNDLEMFTSHAIEMLDIVDANLYLDLLVTKLETLPSHTKPGDYKRKVQILLHTLLHHSMVFKGPQECLKFLRYMPQAGLQIRPATMLRVLSQLRKEHRYDEALYLINNLHSSELLPNQREVLINEIMAVITQKFALHPKVVVGYYASLFKSAGEGHLKLLRDLGVLPMLYGDDVLSDFSNIKRADIHEDLTACDLKHSHLHSMYSTLAKNSKSEMQKPQAVRNLYNKYSAECLRATDTNSPLHALRLDDSIVTLLVECLLKITPGTIDMSLVKDNGRYEAAKEISQDFFNTVKLDRSKKKVFLYELLISSALLHHNDFSFAASMLRHSREMEMPTTFNQIYPFVVYHYIRGETAQAEVWYNLMVKEGVKAKSVAGDRLLSIAKELGWNVKGTLYRRSANMRNQRAREELANLTDDHLSAFGVGTTQEQQSQPRALNLLEDLSAILGAKL